MSSQMVDFKADLYQRYWEYQQSLFPVWQDYFDRPIAEDTRPPVFRKDEAWRNVIVEPGANQQEIDRLLALLPKYDRHKWFRSMNSSQALAQSVFGNLAVHDCLSSLADLQDDDGMKLLGEAQASSDNFVMEFKVDYLGEPRQTSIDVYLGGNCRVAIECKFTESEIGTCSRPRLTPADSNYDSDHCNGTYTKQRARNERCSLTEIGVLYWRYIPQLFHWDGEHDLNPCPVGANYQLVRNALAAGVRPDGHVSTSNGHAVVIYDERNPAFQEGGKGWIAFTETRQGLREPTMLRKCSWQRIIQHMREKNILPWLRELLAYKYGFLMPPICPAFGLGKKIHLSPHYPRMIEQENIPDQLTGNGLAARMFLRAANDDIIHGSIQNQALLYAASCVRRSFPKFREIKLTWERQTPPELCTLEEL